MKTQSNILTAAALSLACIATAPAADPVTPDFLKEIVLKAAPPSPKEKRAFDAVYQLNHSMFNIYDNSLEVYQKNIRARVPLIMALFSGKGGRFILYKPGQEPIEAPSVPVIYQAAKSVGHCAMATYACVAPYIANSKEDQSWVPLMKSYRTEVQTAKDAIVDLAVNQGEQALLQDTLRQVLEFMDNCL
ncbi:MAG: hypothetical protein ACJ8KC_03420, partial [Candidatus Udaeobacter sp.]